MILREWLNIETLEKTESAIKNEQSRDTGNMICIKQIPLYYTET